MQNGILRYRISCVATATCPAGWQPVCKALAVLYHRKGHCDNKQAELEIWSLVGATCAAIAAAAQAARLEHGTFQTGTLNVGLSMPPHKTFGWGGFSPRVYDTSHRKYDVFTIRFPEIRMMITVQIVYFDADLL